MSTSDRRSGAGSGAGVRGLVEWFIAQCGRIPETIVGLCLRVGVGLVFWRSAHTKITGVEIIDAGWLPPLTLPTGLEAKAFTLFQYEYVPNCFVLNPLPPVPLAYMGTAAEYALPLLLFAGLGTRFAALGLLGVTLVIECVYPTAWWGGHLFWAGALLYLMARGPGVFSLDHLVRRHFSRARAR